MFEWYKKRREEDRKLEERIEAELPPEQAALFRMALKHFEGVMKYGVS